MAFNRFTLKISLRLALIFGAMLVLSLLIGQEARLFSILTVVILLLVLIVELYFRLNQTNRIITSLLESVRYGDHNRSLLERTRDLGFGELAESAQEIIRAIASARIDRETQYLYLQSILKHILTAVITLNNEGEPELVNPLALGILELQTNPKPRWAEIQRSSPMFAGAVEDMGENGRRMVSLSNSPGGKKLLILVNTIRLRDKPVKIICFQDIEPEIGRKEMESWQTISRIMAHEIMNSLTPLSSLTETGVMMLEKDGNPVNVESISQKTIGNLYMALKTISDRNAALIRFIQNYRQLSRLPDPDTKQIRVEELLQEIAGLFKIQCMEEGITFTVKKGPPGMSIMADEAQINQVLINLIKNAIEALYSTDDSGIDLVARRIHNKVSIEVKDNGSGISQEILEKIFVPFYSTKPEGSGIGLSLSRQILLNHGGQISVRSEAGKGSSFILSLPEA